MGGHGLALVGQEEADPLARGAAPVFEVDAIEALSSLIDSLGGRVLQRRDMGDHGISLAVADPDGNVFFLLARRPGRRRSGKARPFRCRQPEADCWKRLRKLRVRANRGLNRISSGLPDSITVPSLMKWMVSAICGRMPSHG